MKDKPTREEVYKNYMCRFHQRESLGFSIQPLTWYLKLFLLAAAVSTSVPTFELHREILVVVVVGGILFSLYLATLWCTAVLRVELETIGQEQMRERFTLTQQHEGEKPVNLCMCWLSPSRRLICARLPWSPSRVAYCKQVHHTSCLTSQSTAVRTNYATDMVSV